MNYKGLIATILWFMSAVFFLIGLIMAVVVGSLLWKSGLYLLLIPSFLSALCAYLSVKVESRSW